METVQAGSQEGRLNTFSHDELVFGALMTGQEIVGLDYGARRKPSV